MNWDSPGAALQALGVDTSKPGFYDDPNFLKAERQNPELLELYGAFIQAQKFDRNYLQRAERVIRSAVEFLHERLNSENQLGRCVDASIVLMRFLERQGIWSYAAKGALTIFFDKSTRVSTCYFAPIMMPGNPAVAGHVWLHAPPFAIADFAVQLQPYRGNERKHLPPYVLAMQTTPCKHTSSDLMEPEAVQDFWLKRGRPPTLDDIETQIPGISDAVRRLGAGEVRYGKAVMRYVATGVSAPQEPLEEWRNLKVTGKYPVELYEEFITQLDAR